MQSFDSTVGNLLVDESFKLNRLIEYCTGKTARVIQSCVLMSPSEGYIRARELLMKRFGNEYQIAEAWVKKVTEGPLLKSTSSESFQEFADEVRTCMETLKALHMEGEIDSRLRTVKILKSL